MSQSEMDQCWKKLAEKIEEEVLEKCKVDDNKRGAYRGRSSELEWTRMRKNKNRIRMWREERLLGNNFRIVQELLAADCEESVAPSRRGRSPERK